MRAAVFEAIAEAADDHDLWFLTGDLGYGQLEGLRNRLGKRLVNVGVAEQNLVSVATGLAMTGAKVFAYSIGPFATMRAADQIRMGPVVHELDVTIISGGAGLLYATLGFSHYALQDVSLMRSFPGMTVFAPTTGADLSLVCDRIVHQAGPKYLRLERAPITEEVTSLESRPSFRGADVVVVGYGDVMRAAHAAAEVLEGRGLRLGVVTTPIIDRSVRGRLRDALSGVRAVVSVEEHSSVGGIGSEIAACLAAEGAGARLAILGADDRSLVVFGTRSHL
jgi:transketolase